VAVRDKPLPFFLKAESQSRDEPARPQIEKAGSVLLRHALDDDIGTGDNQSIAPEKSLPAGRGMGRVSPGFNAGSGLKQEMLDMLKTTQTASSNNRRKRRVLLLTTLLAACLVVSFGEVVPAQTITRE
jgi:hypothetical protein